MRVLFISHGANLDGGAEKVLKGIIENLDRNLYQPIVVVPQWGAFSEWLNHQKITYYIISQVWMVFKNAWRFILIVNGFLMIDPVRKLRRIIQKEQIEVVYSNSTVIFGGGIAAKLEGVPHIWHLHEMVFQNPSLGFGFGVKVLNAIINTLSDRIIAVSNAVVENLQLDIENNQPKVFVIPNGLPPEAWEPASLAEIESVRQELGLPLSAQILIFLGNLSAYKKPDKAIETLARIRRDDVYLLMVGGLSPEYIVNRRIDRLLTEFNLKKRVIFTGFRKDVNHLFGLAHVSLVPSCNEAWGLATVEAMAAGVPVVAGDGTSNRDFIKHNETGFLIQNSNPILMAECIEKLLDDPEYAHKIGAAASLASRQFSLEIHSRQVASILNDIADLHLKPITFNLFLKKLLGNYTVKLKKADENLPN